MAVMSLGVKKEMRLSSQLEGEDEEDAIAEIQKVLEENLVGL
ncbi:MAG: HPr family phosphocarrier protein [Coprococcus sp.]